MSKAQEIGQKVQGQTLDAVRNTQDAVVEAVTAWTEDRQQAPWLRQVYQAVPGCHRGHRFQFRLRPADPDQPARLRRPHRGGHHAEDRQAEGHHAEGDQDVRAEGGQEDRARRGKEERSPENGHRSEEIVSGSASGTVE